MPSELSNTCNPTAFPSPYVISGGGGVRMPSYSPGCDHWSQKQSDLCTKLLVETCQDYFVGEFYAKWCVYKGWFIFETEAVRSLTLTELIVVALTAFSGVNFGWNLILRKNLGCHRVVKRLFRGRCTLQSAWLMGTSYPGTYLPLSRDSGLVFSFATISLSTVIEI